LNTNIPATSLSSVSSDDFCVSTDIQVTDIPANSSSDSHSQKEGVEYDLILRLLNRGLSARTSTAREGCRRALKSLKATLGSEIFITCVVKALSEGAVKELLREMAIDVKPSVPIRPTFQAMKGLSSSSSTLQKPRISIKERMQKTNNSSFNDSKVNTKVCINICIYIYVYIYM
jgi:hypothetical protein